MSRVLLGWELGAGIGCSEWLVWIARELKARGCQLMLALCDIEPCKFDRVLRFSRWIYHCFTRSRLIYQTQAKVGRLWRRIRKRI